MDRDFQFLLNTYKLCVLIRLGGHVMGNTSPSLSDRMKEQYEHRYRLFLPRRTYTIIRIDGKNFRSYTRHLLKPFNLTFVNAIDATSLFCCQQFQGAQFGFVQSDELSILLTDFDLPTTEAWFNGNIQKMVSVGAATATEYFGKYMHYGRPVFDARVFVIPDPTEVENYFIWRQQDATRNSIQSAASSVYDHGELEGKSMEQTQEMLFQKGINWNDYPTGLKRGRAVFRDETRQWVLDREPPVFTQDREYLSRHIPRFGDLRQTQKNVG